MLSYLRIIINSNDNNAFERAIGVPSRGVGEKTLTNIRNFAEENSLSLFEAAKKMIAKGFNFVTIGTDQRSLSAGAKAVVEKMKGSIKKEESITY